MTIEEQELLARKWVDGCCYVQTKKGASFYGRVEAMYFNQFMKHWGVVVVATSEYFAGTVHVYPVNQLEPA